VQAGVKVATGFCVVLFPKAHCAYRELELKLKKTVKRIKPNCFL
jgi:hypothetical protein